MAIGAISVTWAWRISVRRLDGSSERAALSAIAITSKEASVHAMVAGGGPFKTPTQNEGLLDERQKDYRDQARKDEIAREVHPSWWHRLRRRWRRGRPEDL
jgi:hypothetical protein